VQNWCLDIGINLNFGKSMIISFTCKMISINSNNKQCNNLVSHSHCVKHPRVQLDCKLYFHHHIFYILSQGLKMLCFIYYIVSSFFHY
jgi:hypothetical protein